MTQKMPSSCSATDAAPGRGTYDSVKNVMPAQMQYAGITTRRALHVLRVAIGETAAEQKPRDASEDQQRADDVRGRDCTHARVQLVELGQPRAPTPDTVNMSALIPTSV